MKCPHCNKIIESKETKLVKKIYELAIQGKKDVINEKMVPQLEELKLSVE